MKYDKGSECHDHLISNRQMDIHKYMCVLDELNENNVVLFSIENYQFMTKLGIMSTKFSVTVSYLTLLQGRR